MWLRGGEDGLWSGEDPGSDQVLTYHPGGVVSASA